MKQHRIFIENLPETVSEDEIKSKFQQFGEVISIEIKERKVVTFKHSSCFFAYVNLMTDDAVLQECFQTFNQEPWHGNYVTLKIAKESFLERLKRERETDPLKKEAKSPVIENTKPVLHNSENNISCETKKNIDNSSIISEKKRAGNKGVKRKKDISCISSDSSEEHTNVNTKNENTYSLDEEDKEPKQENSEEIILVRKANRGAKFINGLLKIEDFGKGSSESTCNQKVLEKHQFEAEIRRKKALDEKRKNYRLQKNAFNLFRQNPKIIKFTDDDTEENGKSSENKKKRIKLTLFDNADSDVDDTLDIKKNIENRIESDKRFELDHRFAEGEQDENSHNQENKDFDILEEVLGEKIKSKQKLNGSSNVPRYIRYDPSNPNHAQYELKNEESQQKSTNKKKKQINEKKAEVTQAPEVSQERVHCVKVDLKAALGQSGGFSIRELFSNEKIEEEKPVEEAVPLPLGNFCLNEKNPYKYDSSDDEDETKELNSEEKPQIKKPKKVWTEPFFFEENDFRYQEGLDFVKRIAAQAKGGDFDESREQLKDIVKKKIRNAKRKSKPLKRKLGGSKKKKNKRWEKALKR